MFFCNSCKDRGLKWVPIEKKSRTNKLIICPDCIDTLTERVNESIDEEKDTRIYNRERDLEARREQELYNEANQRNRDL